MNEIVVPPELRIRAAKRARALRLGRTMVRIQDGKSPDDVREMALEEYLSLHSGCPCCLGSLASAREVADFVYHGMIDNS